MTLEKSSLRALRQFIMSNNIHSTFLLALWEAALVIQMSTKNSGVFLITSFAAFYFGAVLAVTFRETNLSFLILYFVYVLSIPFVGYALNPNIYKPVLVLDIVLSVYVATISLLQMMIKRQQSRHP